MWYHLIFSDNKKAVGYAWNLMGFVAKLAQGVGAIVSVFKLRPYDLIFTARSTWVVIFLIVLPFLMRKLDRDGSRLKVIPEEYERRRAVFWELLNMDCRMVA